MTDTDPTDPDRDTTPGRGPGQGEWLELRLQQALDNWGYATERRVDLIAQEADIVACRHDPLNEPADYLVAECKDWESRLITTVEINRLCLLAFIGRAMPVLCHTTELTEDAWGLAQAYDVRLLTLADLEGDDLPPLTRQRPPRNADTHRQSVAPETLRTRPPMPLLRLQSDQPEMDLDGPVYAGSETAPCYVPDRTGHEAYTDTGLARYRRRERAKRDTLSDDSPS